MSEKNNDYGYGIPDTFSIYSLLTEPPPQPQPDSSTSSSPSAKTVIIYAVSLVCLFGIVKAASKK